jgi:hypothetical protein
MTQILPLNLEISRLKYGYALDISTADHKNSALYYIESTKQNILDAKIKQFLQTI